MYDYQCLLTRKNVWDSRLYQTHEYNTEPSQWQFIHFSNYYTDKKKVVLIFQFWNWILRYFRSAEGAWAGHPKITKMVFYIEKTKEKRDIWAKNVIYLLFSTYLHNTDYIGD